MSVTTEKSGKWAEAEQAGGSRVNEEHAGPSRRLRDYGLSLQNGRPNGAPTPSASEDPLNSEVTSRSEDAIEVPQRATPSAAFPSVPPPPPIPATRESTRAIASSGSRPEASEGIPLQPIRRASQTDDAGLRQSQIAAPAGSVGAQPAAPLQFAPALPAPPPQPYFVPPPASPYLSGQPFGRYAYPGNPNGPSTPYQGMLPGTPQVFASPAPMSTYIPSPEPATLLMSRPSPAAYPGGSVTVAPFPPPQPFTTSPAYLPGSQSAPQSTRPLANASMPTPQSIYGGPSQTDPSRSAPAQPQSTSSPYSQQPVTSGAPVIPQAGLPPGFQPYRTPTRRATDVFIANDPFKASSQAKHDKKDEDVTFDDIPVAGQPGSVQGPTTPALNPYYSAPPTVPYYRPSGPQTPSWTTPSQQQPPPGVDYSRTPSQFMTQTPFSTGGWGTVDYSSPANHWSSVPQTQVPVHTGSSGSSGVDYVEIPSRKPVQPAEDRVPHKHDVEPFIPSSPEYIPGFPEEPDNHEGPPDDTPQAPRPPSPGGRQSPSFMYYDPYRPSSPYDPTTAYGRYPYSPPHIPLDPMLSPTYYGNRPPDQFPPRKQPFWSKVGRMLLLPFWRPRPYEPPTPYIPSAVSEESEKGLTKVVVTFIVGTLPSQVYLHFLLRLPSLYFSRVARIFEEADLTLPDIKKMALETASQGKGNLLDFHMFELQNVPPQYERLKSTWEAFIDSIMREWKTFNIISVLLLSAILTILQIQSASSDPVTRYTALFSLICALMSLLFGCMYIIRFGSMRKTYKAAEWALEAKKTKTIWWNVWVLLAMPAIWLTWSIVLYIACIMSFIWRTSPLDQSPTFQVSHRSILVIRIVISAVLGLGIIYGWLILSTFRRYGTVMDKAWKKRIDGWIEEKAQMQSSAPYSYSTPYYDPSFYPSQSVPYPYAGYTRPAPPYADYSQGYPDPKGGYGFSSPTYPSATYVPPPEPYDSPKLSEEDSATNNVTQSNTLYNKMSSLQPGESSTGLGTHDQPDATSEQPPPPPPLPPNIPLSPGDTPILGASTRVRLAAPPPPSLPPIPGTPATPFIQPTSFRNSYSTEGGHFGSVLGLNLNGRTEEEGFHENRVRFRSPLLSAQPSVLADNDADESPQSGARDRDPGFGLSADLGPPSLDPSGLGQDDDPSESS